MKRTLLLVVLAGCALTSRSAPRELRYFTPEVTHAAAPTPPLAPRAKLRLGRITASANLRHAIVHRVSPEEVAPYETLRWTETPDVYVRHALDHALFAERPLVQVVSGEAPTLEVEATEFEEVAHGARHGGRVTLRYELRGDREVIARGSVTAERPASSPAIEPVVTAIRAAMLAATEELARRVERALLERAAPAPGEGDTSASAQSAAVLPAGTQAPSLQ